MAGITLGLDIGSNSVGWALVDVKGGRITAAGVRVFQEGVDRDTKGAEVSKNATRRTARGARRARKRRNYRKDKLLRLLVRQGLLPGDAAGLQRVFNMDPYFLRTKGLDERLEPYEFGRVLYHINQRRGFLSNRKTGKSKEDGVVIKGATEVQKAMQAKGHRTLGEYFASVDPHEERIRGHYTFRAMFEDEFEQLWRTQRRFMDGVLTEELKEAVKEETIFFQRPLKPADELIGECDLEDGEKRCPRADWHARRMRILQTVNNLRIRTPDSRERELTAEERETVLGELCSRKDVPFDSLRKKLGLLESQTFNFEDGTLDKKNAKLQGDEFAAHLRRVLGRKVFEKLEVGDVAEINDMLVYSDAGDEELAGTLMAQYRFSEEQARGIVDITLPGKYAHLSRVAIQKLLPKLEAGLRTDEAIVAVYGRAETRRKTTVLDQLPAPEELRNPIVNRALWEVRKVVNAVVREYGKPDRIAVEMARDVKGSKKERDEIRLKQWKQEQENLRARQELQKMGIDDPSRDDIIKFKLWEECGKVCPYTGRPIGQHQLFGEHPEVQIEHILPYSRSLDDSYMNKTLCFVNENRLKKNETPYEYYAEAKPEQYEQILQRVRTLPYAKRRRFRQENVELENFIQRQLNDTRYISRKVVEYLKVLGKPVQGSRGQITAELRHQWGLNWILDDIGPGVKRRDDHRHHAIDAAVTAVAGPKHLRDLAQSKYDSAGAMFDPPWPKFRDDLQEAINRIQVSHRVTRKVSGQLHEETSYGPTGLKDDKGQDVFVYRKRLEDLTLPMVGKIVDDTVREIVRGRLREHGVDPDGKGSISKEVWKEPLYMKSVNGRGPQIKKVRIRDVFNNMILVKDQQGAGYRAVAPGNNHHVEVFECSEGNNNRRMGRVVSMYEAVQRSRRGEPVVCREGEAGQEFVCSLGKNEMFMLEVDDGEYVLHRVQKLGLIGGNVLIVLRPHAYAGKVSDSDRPPLIQRKSPNTLKGYKVTVDPIGRIHKAHD